MISKHWEYYGALLGAVSTVLPLLGLIFFLPESPKFMFVNNRTAELRRTLDFIGRVNGRVRNEGEATTSTDIQSSVVLDEELKQDTQSLRGLMAKK